MKPISNPAKPSTTQNSKLRTQNSFCPDHLTTCPLPGWKQMVPFGRKIVPLGTLWRHWHLWVPGMSPVKPQNTTCSTQNTPSKQPSPQTPKRVSGGPLPKAPYDTGPGRSSRNPSDPSELRETQTPKKYPPGGR